MSIRRNYFQKERISETILKSYREKGQRPVTIITTRLAGHLKNFFFGDLLRRENTEAELIRNIIEIHYSIIGEFPELKDKDFSDIKYQIITRMKGK